VNQRLFYAMATGDLRPLVKALEDTRTIPRNAQWVNFLRSHDELDLGRLTDAQRQRTFEAFAPEPGMQLYGRGIRRRLAPMLNNDRRRLELAFSLLLTLPGTPMIQYGDEIGLGDDLSLPERECARTPMQWSGEVHGGFSAARRPVRPVISDPIYGYKRVSVAEQRRDQGSLLNWMGRAIRMRKECPEISWGAWTLLGSDASDVLIMRYVHQDRAVLTAHNFGERPRAVTLNAREVGSDLLVDMLADGGSTAEGGKHVLELAPYCYRWYRVGGMDRLATLSK
jgi:maltose alpha-D-glucosyltransferase/alpha-amylase